MKDRICTDCVRYECHPRDIFCGDCIHNGEQKKDNFKSKEVLTMRDGRRIFIINE